MKLLIQVPVGVAPCQIEGFGEKVERSGKGALHIRPSSTLVITEGELEFIQKEHKQLASRLVVVKKMDEGKSKAKADKPKEEPKSATVEEKTEEDVESSTLFGSGKDKKKSKKQ